MDSQGRKTVLFHSCFSKNKTGFSRNQRAILTALYKTGKYDIVEYATGLSYNHPLTKEVPWKCFGVLPDSEAELQAIQKGDQGIARAIGYGAYNIDRVVYETKPDVIFSIEDFWGINYMIDKPYFRGLNCVLWTTLDSLPLLPEAVDNAPKIPHYYVWSEFAEKEMHRLGFNHVKTLHGAIETKAFRRLDNSHRKELRERAKLDDKFVIGFVFRNQLRKLVPNLLEGYALWKKQNPGIKSALLLHTYFSEQQGWNIPRLIKQYNVNPEEVYTTYICRQCATYEIKPFQGEEIDCHACQTGKAQVTTNTIFGVTEEQLNEVYNVMDVYIHPFTSGGQEMPIQEAKLAELIALVTDYSCGEDMCVPEAGSLPLSWHSYPELGTQFKKATTDPWSIAKQLQKVYVMKPEVRTDMGRRARQWVIKNYSTEVIVGKIIDIIEGMPPASFDYAQPAYQPKNVDYPLPQIENNLVWVKTLYKEILNMNEPDDSEGVVHWLNALDRGLPRQDIYNYFVQEATKENAKNMRVEFSKILGDELPENRVLFCMPESLGDLFLCTALFKSLRETYPDKKIYVATKPQFQDVIQCNPYIDQVLDWQPFMEDLLAMEGSGENKGYFEIVFLPHLGTQRILDYLHNGSDKVAFRVDSFVPDSLPNWVEEDRMQTF